MHGKSPIKLKMMSDSVYTSMADPCARMCIDLVAPLR